MSADSTLSPRPATTVSRHRPSDKGVDSLFAGGMAGAVEAMITFPTDLCKTHLQLGNLPAQKNVGLVSTIRSIYLQKGLAGYYAGAPPVIVGNAVKSCVRFASYEWFKQMLRDEEGKVNRTNNLLAGLMAGAAESIVAVAPSEAIKTRIIKDSLSPNPQYRNSTHAVRIIIAHEGVIGLYQGLGSVILKQSINSAVRFSTYALLTEYYDECYKVKAGNRPSISTFMLGAMSGIVTVYASQPFDVAKTRLQTGQAAKSTPGSSIRSIAYNGTFSCLANVFREQGVKALWKGSSMRLIRLSMSGGIQFFVYEKVTNLIGPSSLL